MYYGGHKIIVENYLYMLHEDRTKKYLTLKDIMNVIDGMSRKEFIKQNKTTHEGN